MTSTAPTSSASAEVAFWGSISGAAGGGSGVNCEKIVLDEIKLPVDPVRELPALKVRKSPVTARSFAEKFTAVRFPLSSVNELWIGSFHSVAMIGVASPRPSDEGADVMITSVAALVELFVSPKISPLTVPLTVPEVFVNEKRKSSAHAGTLNRVIPEMSRTKAITPKRKYASDGTALNRRGLCIF